MLPARVLGDADRSLAYSQAVDEEGYAEHCDSNCKSFPHERQLSSIGSRRDAAAR
jgi:hypothetical protein